MHVKYVMNAMYVMHAMYAHVDMNSYFASVEQQANPHWRGRPLGVCAYLHKNGCVIAASIEAKKSGAKVGMSLDECRSACPDMVFVQNDPPKYRAVTSRVFALFHELTDRVEHYSIDEAFLDLTGWYRDEAEAAWALCKTRLRIQREIGDWLKCSIGIAPSKFLAKLASDLEKPNGLVIINQENLDDILAKLEVEKAWGIGSRIRRRLNKLGIYTLMDLKRYPVGNLMQVLGKAGWMWHERLCGRDVDRLEQANERPPKSIGHSFCVPKQANRTTYNVPRTTSLIPTVARPKRGTLYDVRSTILAILIRLAERAGRRLRSFGLLTRSMTVEVGVHDVHHVHSVHSVATVCFGEAVSDVFSLAHGATQLLESIWDGKSQVMFLAVTLNDLVPPNGQLPLSASFCHSDRNGVKWRNPSYNNQTVEQGITRLRALSLGTTLGMTNKRVQEASHAVDAIRDRYGEESIVFASMLGLSKDYAPDRIGFRKTEGVDIN
ncbi:MAG: DNA polymerase IV [Patescibacteria group bacterium]